MRQRPVEHNDAVAEDGHCPCLCHVDYRARCVCGAEEWLRADPPLRRRLRPENLESHEKPFQKARSGKRGGTIGAIAAKDHHHALRDIS